MSRSAESRSVLAGTHGTHVAGTIAAAKNKKGVVGVAPGVKIASVRIAEEPSGLFFPENTVCGFMFSGNQGFDVTNNSYYTDPWQFNCPDDPDQAAIIEGVKRAAAFAKGKGVLHVAAAGKSLPIGRSATGVESFGLSLSVVLFARS